MLQSFYSNLPASVGYRANFSGVCSFPSTGDLLIILNRGQSSTNGAIEVFSHSGAFKRHIDLVGFDDTEGICLYNAASNQFAISEEGLNQITIVTITGSTTSINKSTGRTLAMQLGNLANEGIEGITYDASRLCFYAVREKAPIGVYKVTELGGTNSITTPLFNAPSLLGGLCSDLSDLHYDAATNRLFILSDESAVVVECTLAGAVQATLALDTMAQPEGLLLTDDRQNLFVVGEPNEMAHYLAVQNQLKIQMPPWATEGDGVVTGMVSVLDPPGANLTVNLTLSDISEATVPNSVVIPGAQTFVSFPVTIVDDDLLDGGPRVWIEASAIHAVTVSNSMVVADDETATLTVELPAIAREGDGVLTNAGTVHVSPAPDTPVAVSLQPYANAEVSVTTRVTLPAGASNVSFNVFVVDDTRIDKAQVATVRADVAGWPVAYGTMEIEDNEATNLMVTLPLLVQEGGGMVTNGGRVSIAGTLTNGLLVALVSSDPTELSVTPSVTISAGQTSAAFSLTPADDAESDLLQVVFVTATAAGFMAGSNSVAVRDNEPATNYVSKTGASQWPYMTWATAATNIQDAIDVLGVGGVVLVSNGVYDGGDTHVAGALTGNRLVIPSGVTVRSLNGADVTVIAGSGGGTTNAVRCAYLYSGATLAGFTLTNGVTATLVTNADTRGGAVWCVDAGARIQDCVLIGNMASAGGGAYRGTLERCLVAGNMGGSGGGVRGAVLRDSLILDNTASSGGGTYEGLLYNCTVSGNIASFAGGCFGGTQRNCVIYFNMAGGSANHSSATMFNSCTTPAPAGSNNITGDPRFINRAAGNYRLRLDAPCINAGTNGVVSSSVDIEGLARIVGGTVDMGAHEYDGRIYDTDSDTMTDAWESGHQLNPTNASDAMPDDDGDGWRNGDEFVADTDPTNAASCFRIESISNGPPFGVGFFSSALREYTLEFSDSLATGAWRGVEGQESVPGTGGPRTANDVNAPPNQGLYRLKVSLPW